MTPKIAVFYHCLFGAGEPPQPLPAAMQIVSQAMEALSVSGLLEAAAEVHIGINNGPEAVYMANHLIPPKAKIRYHGSHCRNENRTILLMEEWLSGNPGYLVLYFHAKGATRALGDRFSTSWRNCMMNNLIYNWRRCVEDLAEFEAVGCHWIGPPMTPPGQHIFGGNFWWARSEYLLTLPSILERDRIKISGLDALESRYEAEVWIGNGKRTPRVRDYHIGHPAQHQTS